VANNVLEVAREYVTIVKKKVILVKTALHVLKVVEVKKSATTVPKKDI
jgi:hypothetical protein